MDSLADYWNLFQAPLFTRIESALGEPLSDKLKQLIRVLDIIRVEKHIPSRFSQWMGRSRKDRRAIARAFITKAVYDLSTTKFLIEMLHQQESLRRLCGFERLKDIPSEATFSRAFAQFAKNKWGDIVHEALVKTYVGNKVVMHISRDATEVDAREKPARKVKPKAEEKPKRKPGHPKKGDEPPPKEPTRLKIQLKQTAEQSLSELPYVCDVGGKKNSKGNAHWWVGYKAHIDWADGAIPLNVLTTSASLHDSQVAIPMMRVTAERTISLYDLMDSAYDSEEIISVSEELGHVPIIDKNRRSGPIVPMEPYRAERYKERSTAERGNSRLKDEFGLRHLRVRGHSKVHLHIMFGIMALFADQYIKVFSG